MPNDKTIAYILGNSCLFSKTGALVFTLDIYDIIIIVILYYDM